MKTVLKKNIKLKTDLNPDNDVGVYDKQQHWLK